MLSIGVLRRALERLNKANDKLGAEVDEAIHDGKYVEDISYNIESLQSEVEDVLSSFGDFLDDLQDIKNQL